MTTTEEYNQSELTELKNRTPLRNESGLTTTTIGINQGIGVIWQFYNYQDSYDWDQEHKNYYLNSKDFMDLLTQLKNKNKADFKYPAFLYYSSSSYYAAGGLYPEKSGFCAGILEGKLVLEDTLKEPQLSFNGQSTEIKLPSVSNESEAIKIIKTLIK